MAARQALSVAAAALSPAERIAWTITRGFGFVALMVAMLIIIVMLWRPMFIDDVVAAAESDRSARSTDVRS